MKLTPWFPHATKPVHIGVYPIKFRPLSHVPVLHEGYAHWNGYVWGMSAPSIEKAFEYRVRNQKRRTSAKQEKQWRGFTHKPVEGV